MTTLKFWKHCQTALSKESVFPIAVKVEGTVSLRAFRVSYYHFVIFANLIWEIKKVVIGKKKSNWIFSLCLCSAESHNPQRDKVREGMKNPLIAIGCPSLVK